MIQDIPQITSQKISKTTSQSSYVTKLLLTGLIFHLVFIGSVFDCYFTSPVVHGMRSYGGQDTGEAKRLVLIIGDGLRADLLFSVDAFPGVPGSPHIVAPYLRSIVEERGAFGISHTRVPTESRPGHVAIIGGMYEDVSAVTKGWKTNPVDFDSVFNQSSTTFSFGSPDILPMFAKGAVPGKVRTWSYDGDEEDFTKGMPNLRRNATALDIWVLDQLSVLLKNATTNATLDTQLRSGKVVFFLHLLGLDTTGHSYRPHSREYMENIRIVDNIVRQTEQLISDFYHDHDTSFIFTADHGMSAIGNHGDGHPDNTQTPLIAWGKGIRGPLPDTQPSSHDDHSKPWKLGHLYRRDIEQADITSLMAALIGINWPANSVGVLPDVDPTRPGYLEPQGGDRSRALAALTNAKVILEHYRVKHEGKQQYTLFYKPFRPLSEFTTPDNSNQVKHIEDLIKSEAWFAARQASLELIQQGLQGLHYLQTYDRFLIRGFVTVAYIGWAAYASLSLFQPLRKTSNEPRNSSSRALFVNLASFSLLSVFWGLFLIQKSPWTFYLYISFPIYFWREVLLQGPKVFWSAQRLDGEAISKGKGLAALGVRTVLVVAALLGMVAGYTHRSIWSIGFVLIGLVWPLTWPVPVLTKQPNTTISWAAACLVTASFPLLSVDKDENLVTIMLGGIAILIVGSRASVWVLNQVDVSAKGPLLILFALQLSLVLITMVITASSVGNLQAKMGLPVLNQAAGWTVLVASSLIPFISKHRTSQTPYARLLVYFLGFGPLFVILAISIEGLFYVAYSVTLVLWIEVEKCVRDVPKERKTSARSGNGYEFQPADLRIALFFLFFVQVGFFGTGNVASISSFYLAPVYRLIPIFSPFFMASLLIFKIVAPYIILSITFAMLNKALHLPPFSLLLVALTITDGMTLTFFFQVQDTGSWLEIGQSISFFCITSLLMLWAAGICAAGEGLMVDVLHPSLAPSMAKKAAVSKRL